MTQFLDFPGLRARMAIEPRFGIEFLKMAERLNLVPDYILSVISIETVGTFNPAIQNPTNSNPELRATGLIQFMPKTAALLGTSIATLRQMTAVEQLQYVERFFKLNGSKIRKDVPGDYYMAVFMPAFVGADEKMVLGRKDDPTMLAGLSLGAIYAQNVGFDRQKKGFFTVGDVWNATLSRIAAARQKPPIEVTAPGPLAPPEALPPSPSQPLAWRSSGGLSDLPALRVGARGSAVALAQVLLRSDVVTGVYTTAMCDEYVKPFQKAHGLVEDGVLGPRTWELLATCKADA